jgi:hypothetical protein
MLIEDKARPKQWVCHRGNCLIREREKYLNELSGNPLYRAIGSAYSAEVPGCAG